MPDRIIRDELLTSDKWLGLKDPSDRLVFIAMLLTADDFGNLEASPFHIKRIAQWSAGVDTIQKATAALENLVEAELIMIYHVDFDGYKKESKQYAHIPKFRQRLRFPKNKHPLPEWQQALYSPDVTQNAWVTKIRPAILARDNHRCALCGSDNWLHVDHIIPLANGGKSVDDNLITLCRKCNTRKGAKSIDSQKLKELALSRNQGAIDPQLTLSAEVKRSEEKLKGREVEVKAPVDNSRLASALENLKNNLTKT